MTRKGTGFAVELFNGHNDFTLWQQRVKSILTREGLVKALKKKSEKPEGVKDDKWVTALSKKSSMKRIRQNFGQSWRVGTSPNH
ncbi:hypothetical protein RHGRI_015095 [Rhododendron griersonianum]|uniref:Uncharacterized protein n=1 Tax=Rhododendron griersonianum TaxID=479676 RepID=A0AAV6KBY7_9ERIC|nr:hypothetical protein RHGRI_015095 [Rhododendron griersonianum]